MVCNSTKSVRFPESLSIPEGPKAGKPVKLATFQKQFVRGTLADAVNVACVSIGWGDAKTALSSGVALGALIGAWDRHPLWEFLITPSRHVDIQSAQSMHPQEAD